jgi:YD repeat-containing protein
MKKLLVYGLWLTLSLITACKKDKQPQNIYLLKQETIDGSVAYFPIDTINYTYDGKNQLTAIRISRQETYAITYDNAGRVVTALRSNYNGPLIREYDFFYKADTIGFYSYGPSHPRDTSLFIFNDKHQAIRLQTLHKGYQLYTYDSRGNIATLDSYNADATNNLADHISYLYDSQRNPFSDLPPNNYYFMYVAYTDVSTLINNVLVKNADRYSYTYNADGFPVKGVGNFGYDAPITFSYIIKPL